MGSQNNVSAVEKENPAAGLAIGQVDQAAFLAGSPGRAPDGGGVPATHRYHPSRANRSTWTNLAMFFHCVPIPLSTASLAQSIGQPVLFTWNVVESDPLKIHQQLAQARLGLPQRRGLGACQSAHLVNDHLAVTE